MPCSAQPRCGLAPHPTHHQHCHLEPGPWRPHGCNECPGVLLGVVALHGAQALLPVVAPCKREVTGPAFRGTRPPLAWHPCPGSPAAMSLPLSSAVPSPERAYCMGDMGFSMRSLGCSSKLRLFSSRGVLEGELWGLLRPCRKMTHSTPSSTARHKYVLPAGTAHRHPQHGATGGVTELDAKWTLLVVPLPSAAQKLHFFRLLVSKVLVIDNYALGTKRVLEGCTKAT